MGPCPLYGLDLPGGWRSLHTDPLDTSKVVEGANNAYERDGDHQPASRTKDAKGPHWNASAAPI